MKDDHQSSAHRESPSELRRLICEAAETASRLDAERYALEEVRDDLKIRERDLSDRLSSAEESGSTAGGQVSRREQVLRELESEIEATSRENRARQRELASAEMKLRQLDRESDHLLKELKVLRGAASAAEMRLETVHESLLRMDRKLSATQRTHTPPCLDRNSG